MNNCEYYLFFSIILVNALWYSTKMVCKKNGYPISLFINHHWDIMNMVDIIKKEESIANKIFYLLLLSCLIILIAATIILIILI